jgi:phospho-N-acetylmuramoyl-pentapeptide-transferase
LDFPYAPIIVTLQAAICAGILTFGAGRLLLPLLRRRCGQNIRDDGPAAHLQKAGTPTMGGLFFLIGVTASLLITHLTGAAPPEPASALLLMIFLGFGLLGFADDLLKIRRRRNLGLRAWQKLLAEILLAALFAFLAVKCAGRGTSVLVPFGGVFDLGPAYPFLVVLIVVAATNAVNLTDGLDGLAAGSVCLSALGYVGMGLLALAPQLPLSGGTAAFAFAAALAGACPAFLIFNRFPAKVFMGDCGSLALGGALAGLAVLTGTELYLLPLGILYVLEALSVIAQVVSFKTRGKRVLRMAPLHHHFELGGWPEKKVVRLFWAISAGGAALTLLLLALS